MDWLWTWRGVCFGYRSGDELRTQDGRHVGHFHGDEVYGRDGRYLGEIRNGDRLISNRSKRNKRQGRFTPYAKNVGYVKHVNYVGNVMLAGYDDFPAPTSFDASGNPPDVVGR